MELRCDRLETLESIVKIRRDYLRTLVAPMDGMWEGAVIARAEFWTLCDRDQSVGHFCLDAGNVLLRFWVERPYRGRARHIFQWLVAHKGIRQAIAATIEPAYLSLCLDGQISVALHSYLFGDNERVEFPAALRTYSFARGERFQFERIARFYGENTDGPGDWIENFVSTHLARGELFLLSDEGTVLATGECIPSEFQKPFADIGMVVAREYRNRGLGRAVLLGLKHHCYDQGWQPICSCTAENQASKRAIENAGFASNHRTVRLSFHRDA